MKSISFFYHSVCLQYLAICFEEHPLSESSGPSIIVKREPVDHISSSRMNIIVNPFLYYMVFIFNSVSVCIYLIVYFFSVTYSSLGLVQ